MLNYQKHEGCCCKIYHHSSFRGLRFNIRQDINRYLTKSAFNRSLGKSRKRKLSAFLTPEIQSLCLHRFAHFLHVNHWNFVSKLISRFNLFWHKVNISPQSCIGPGCRLSHPPGVVFNGRAGRHLTIFSLAYCGGSVDYLEAQLQDCPRLGNHVQLGAYTATHGALNIDDKVKIFPVLQIHQSVSANKIVVRKQRRYQMVANDKTVD